MNLRKNWPCIFSSNARGLSKSSLVATRRQRSPPTRRAVAQNGWDSTDVSGGRAAEFSESNGRANKGEPLRREDRRLTGFHIKAGKCDISWSRGNFQDKTAIRLLKLAVKWLNAIESGRANRRWISSLQIAFQLWFFSFANIAGREEVAVLSKNFSRVGICDVIIFQLRWDFWCVGICEGFKEMKLYIV